MESDIQHTDMRENIHNSLRTIQQKLNAPKDLKNTFGGYNYRSCESILSAVKPLLELTKTTLTFMDQIVNFGDRFYILSTAVLSNGSEQITATGIAREELSKKGMDASQLSGATSSYARKYALNALFAIDDNRDPDVVNRHATTDKEIAKQALSDIQSCNTIDELKSVFAYYNHIVPNLCTKDAVIQKASTKRRKELEQNTFDER